MDAILFGQMLVGTAGIALGAGLVWIIEAYLHHQKVAALPAVTAPPVAAAIVAEPDAAMVAAAGKSYETVMARAAEQFDHDLAATSGLINEQIKRMSGDIIGTELEHYREGINELREQALATMRTIEAEAVKQREALKGTMTEEVAAEKDRLIALIDRRLGESVGAFLIETLRHNVDLGAQGPYLTAMLEEHKDELKAEVTSEV